MRKKSFLSESHDKDLRLCIAAGEIRISDIIYAETGDIMILRKLAALAGAFLFSAVMTISVSAENYKADVSSAVPTNNWGQSFTMYTPFVIEEGKDYSENFDPLWMTPTSEVWVGYEISEELSVLDESPVELIWQTWEVNGKLADNVNKAWNQILPYEYDATHAIFRYNDIVQAYGTDDFSSVYCICIGDRLGNKNAPTVKVTSLTFTNIQKDIAEDVVTERVKIVTTRAEVSMGETYVPASDTSTNSSVTTVVFIVAIIAAVIVAAIAVLIVIIFKKKNSYKG